MKKMLTIFSSLMCLLLASNVYSNQCYAQSQYPTSCVGQCTHACVEKAQPKGKFYVGAFGGANWLNIHHKLNDKHGFRSKTKLGYVGGGSLGYKFANGFRMEGEVAYRRNALSAKLKENEKMNGKATTYSWSYMANFLYDFDGVSCHLPNIVPYVGFGVGYTQNHIHAKLREEVVPAHHVKGKSSGVAYQAITGVSYRLTEDTSIGMEYRYYAGRSKADDHSVGLALRQSF